MAKTPFFSPAPTDPLPEGWAEAFEIWRQKQADYRVKSDKAAAMIPEHLQMGYLPLGTELDLNIFVQLEATWRQQLLELTLWRLAATVPSDLALSIMLDAKEFTSSATRGLRVNWKPDVKTAQKNSIEKGLTEFRKLLGTTTDGYWAAVGHRRNDKIVVQTGLDVAGALRTLAPDVGIEYEQRVLARSLDQDESRPERRGPRL